MNTLKCYTYWATGLDAMPSIINYIYNQNYTMSLNYNFELILLTDNNINEFIDNLPSRFWDLNPEFKSEIIRFYILDKFGGVWLNPDIIIIKDLNKLYNKFINSRKQVMVDIEFYERLGCASIIMLPNSICSKFCINYINNILETTKNLMWDDIGHNTITSLFESFSDLMLINNYEKVRNSTNLICWDQKPEIFKDKWYKENSDDAKYIGIEIINNLDCYYVITWSIYKSDIDRVFNDDKSIFYYLIKYKENNNRLYIILFIILILFIIIIL